MCVDSLLLLFRFLCCLFVSFSCSEKIFSQNRVAKKPNHVGFIMFWGFVFFGVKPGYCKNTQLDGFGSGIPMGFHLLE